MCSAVLARELGLPYSQLVGTSIATMTKVQQEADSDTLKTKRGSIDRAVCFPSRHCTIHQLRSTPEQTQTPEMLPERGGVSDCVDGGLSAK